MKKKFSILFVVILSLWFVISFFYKKDDLLRPKRNISNYRNIEIKSTNINNLVYTLSRKNLIRDKTALLKYISKNRKVIHPGTYYLSEEMRADDIYKVITNSKSKKVSFTISTKDTINKIIKNLNLVLKRNDNNFMKTFKSKKYIDKLNDQYKFINKARMINKDIEYYLEGYLFTGNYNISLNDSSEKIINTLLQKTKKMYNKYVNIMKSKGLSFHKVISLSSCLISELGYYYEQYKDVSGIYWNRINDSMMLQLDATYIYGYNHGYSTRNKDANISMNSMRLGDISKFNTYKFYGAPVGGINSISEKSLKAILYPNKNSYKFYYHHTKNGVRKVEYSNTYKEHLEKIKR